MARLFFYGGMVTVTWLHVRIEGLTLSDYLFLLSLIIATVEAMVRGIALPRLPWKLVLGAALLAIGSILSTVFASKDPSMSVAILVRVLYLLLVWSLLSCVVLRNQTHVRRAVLCWIASAAVCGGWAVFQKLGLVSSPAESLGRVSGLTEHVNDLGASSAIVLAPALTLASITQHKARWLAALCIAAGLAFSGSIGASMAAIIAILAILLISRDLTRPVVVACVFAAVCVFYASSLGQLEGTQLARYDTATTSSAGEGQDTLLPRQEVLAVAWQRIGRDPLIGVGLDTSSSSIYSYSGHHESPVHNLIVGRWYESGVFGFIGILLVLWSLLAVAWRVTMRATSDEEQVTAIGLFAAIIAFIAVGMSEPLLYNRFALAPAALILAMATLQRTRSPTITV